MNELNICMVCKKPVRVGRYANYNGELVWACENHDYK